MILAVLNNNKKSGLTWVPLMFFIERVQPLSFHATCSRSDIMTGLTERD